MRALPIITWSISKIKVLMTSKTNLRNSWAMTLSLSKWGQIRLSIIRFVRLPNKAITRRWENFSWPKSFSASLGYSLVILSYLATQTSMTALSIVKCLLSSSRRSKLSFWRSKRMLCNNNRHSRGYKFNPKDLHSLQESNFQRWASNRSSTKSSVCSNLPLKRTRKMPFLML